MKDAVDRFISRQETSEDTELLITQLDAWLAALNERLAEVTNRIQQVLSDGLVQVDIYEKLGREGRQLALLSAQALQAEYLPLSRKKLSIERAIERTHRLVGLADATSAYRSNLVEYLIEQIRLHKECAKGLGDENDSRLWASIEGIHP